MVTFEIFARAAIGLLSGATDTSLPFALAHASPSHFAIARASPDSFPRCGVTREVTPVAWKGSGDIPALCRANACIWWPTPNAPNTPCGDLDSHPDQMSKLSHFDDSGQPRMVDVSGKGATKRTARAHAFVRMSPEVLASLSTNPKGDPLVVARIAGIQAAKRTAELIPLCHTLLSPLRPDVAIMVEADGRVSDSFWPPQPALRESKWRHSPPPQSPP